MSILVDDRGKTTRRASISIIPPSVNEGLKVLAIFHLRVIFFPQIPISLRFRGIELSKVPVATIRKNQVDQAYSPFVIIQATGMLMYDVRRNCVSAIMEGSTIAIMNWFTYKKARS